MRLILIGIALMACGIGLVSLVQIGVDEMAKIDAVLEPGQSMKLESALQGPDTGVLRITLDTPRASAQVSVISPTGQTIYDNVHSTRQAVDYYEIGPDGVYTMNVMLVSAQPSIISAEFGQGGSSETMYPAIILVSGIVIIVLSLCVRLVRYITAQPDENTL